MPAPNDTEGVRIITPPPETGLVSGGYVGIFRGTKPISIEGESWPRGTYYLRSVPSPYSVLGTAPELLPFRILPEYREMMDRGQQQIIQHYDVPWNYRTYWVQAMLGDSYVDGVNRVRRSLPPSHPDYPHMIPTHCECLGGVGVPEGNASALLFVKRDNQGSIDDPPWGFARYSVTWSAVSFALRTDTEIDELSDEEAAQGTYPFNDTYPPDLLDGRQVQGELWRYVTRQEDFATESLTLSSLSGMQTVETEPQPNGEVPAKVFPLREVTYTWHQVPQVPRGNIEACLGKANNCIFDVVTTVGGFYDAETLLFVGAKYLRSTTPTGRLTYDIEYKWLYRPNGWRKVLRPGDAFTFVYVTTTGTLAGTFVYDVVEMPRLFRMT